MTARLRPRAARSAGCFPGSRQVTIARHGLLQRLLQASAQALVTITAPVGYGKTTVLQQWEAKDERDFIWIRLDPADDEPRALIHRLAAAVDPSGALEAHIAAVRDGDGLPDCAAIPPIAGAVDDRTPCVLVIDDFHVVRSPLALQVIADVLHAVPTHCQVVLSGHVPAAAHLGRYALERGFLRLTEEDLALDETEAATLFASVGAGTARAQIAEIVQRAAGWPLGLHYVAATIAGWERSHIPGGSFDLDRFVARVTDELLESQDRSLVDFLERSAVHRPLDAALIDEIIGGHESAESMARLDEAGSPFVLPPEVEGGPVRAREVFADALWSRLRRRDPELAMRLELRASHLLEARGDVDAAIGHALEAGDPNRAADLTLGVAIPLVLDGQRGTLRDFLDRLPPEVYESSPSAAVARAWYHLVTGDVDAMVDAIAVARCAGAEAPSADGPREAFVALAAVEAAAALHGLDRVIDDSDAVLAEGSPPSDPARGLATVIRGTALLMSGEPQRARRCFLQALTTGSANPWKIASAQAGLALLSLERNDVRDADRLARKAVELADHPALHEVVPMTPVFPVAALVSARAGDIERAGRHVERAEAELTRAAILPPPTALLTNLLLGQAALMTGDIAAAHAFASRAEVARPRCPSAVAFTVQLDELREQLSSGESELRLVDPLTTGELRVLSYLPSHLSLQQIAGQLILSRNTVKSHCQAIYRKLGVHTRGEAVTTARRLGLVGRPHTIAPSGP